jgi:hypothetical protein
MDKYFNVVAMTGMVDLCKDLEVGLQRDLCQVIWKVLVMRINEFDRFPFIKLDTFSWTKIQRFL